MSKNKFHLFKKVIKAPPYFKEHQEEIDKMDKFCADLCGFSVKWWREQMQTDHFSETILSISKEKKWTETQKKKVERLNGIASVFTLYCSAKFQNENIDSEWGKADYIQYNIKNDELELKWLREKLKRGLKQVYLDKDEKEQKKNKKKKNVPKKN